jgi:hypothetical protein
VGVVVGVLSVRGGDADLLGQLYHIRPVIDVPAPGGSSAVVGVCCESAGARRASAGFADVVGGGGRDDDRRAFGFHEIRGILT